MGRDGTNCDLMGNYCDAHGIWWWFIYKGISLAKLVIYGAQQKQDENAMKIGIETASMGIDTGFLLVKV